MDHLSRKSLAKLLPQHARTRAVIDLVEIQILTGCTSCGAVINKDDFWLGVDTRIVNYPDLAKIEVLCPSCQNPGK